MLKIVSSLVAYSFAEMPQATGINAGTIPMGTRPLRQFQLIFVAVFTLKCEAYVSIVLTPGHP